MAIDIYDKITDGKILMRRYIIRDGFVFKAITHPGNVYDAIVLRVPSDVSCDSPLLPKSQRSLQEHLALIRERQIEKALVIADSLDFLQECPDLRHICIIPTENANESTFYSPLYELPALKTLQCQTVGKKACCATNSSKEPLFCIDYANLPNIESVGVCQKGHLNYNKLPKLKALRISGYGGADLTQVFSSPVLNTLSMTQCKLQTLEGIQQSERIQCLYLYYDRSLCDISALRKVKNSLRALRIENCPKIKDFSVLGELENLELLELSGSNELPSLDFLLTMKNLKTFVFNINVKDGDLTPCLHLSYVYSERNRKHYNLKDADLPKGKYIRGNETLQNWLRME